LIACAKAELDKCLKAKSKWCSSGFFKKKTERLCLNKVGNKKAHLLLALLEDNQHDGKDGHKHRRKHNSEKPKPKPAPKGDKAKANGDKAKAKGAEKPKPKKPTAEKKPKHNSEKPKPKPAPKGDKAKANGDKANAKGAEKPKPTNGKKPVPKKPSPKSHLWHIRDPKGDTKPDNKPGKNTPKGDKPKTGKHHPQDKCVKKALDKCLKTQSAEVCNSEENKKKAVEKCLTKLLEKELNKPAPGGSKLGKCKKAKLDQCLEKHTKEECRTKEKRHQATKECLAELKGKSGEKPPKMIECTAPTRAQASMA